MNKYKEKFQQQILFGDGEASDLSIKVDTPQIIVDESDWIADDQMELNQASVEVDYHEVINSEPPKKTRWLWRGVAALFATLVGIETVQFFINGFAQSPFVAGLYATLLAGLSVIALGSVWRELSGFRQFKNQQTLQQQADEILNQESKISAMKFCETLSKRLPCDTAEYDHSKWDNIAVDDLNDTEILHLYSRNILSQVDKKALDEITKFSTESVVLITLSPIAVIDMLIMLWRNLRLVNKIAALYGIKLGYWSRVKLIKQVIINMAYAGASELVADLGADLLGAELLGKLSGRMAQGLGAGMLTARLGLKAMHMCRPIPFYEDTPKLGHVRHQVIGQVKKLLSSNK